MKTNYNNSKRIGGKIPPNAKDIEAELLGAIISETISMRDIMGILTSPEMFYRPDHQMIYEKALELANKGVSVDSLVLVSEFTKEGNLEEIGGPAKLISLGNNAILNTSKGKEYAVIILEKWIHRELIQLGDKLITAGFDEEDISETIYQTNLMIDRIGTRTTSKSLRPISEVLFESLQRIEADLSKDSTSFTGVDTGFKQLNEVTGGWQKTDLIILAARPAVGKTALALNFAYAASKMVTVAVFSLEMGSSQLGNRLISISSGIPLDHITKPYKVQDKEAFKAKLAANNDLFDRNIHFDDTPGLKLSQIKALCMKLKKQIDHKRKNGNNAHPEVPEIGLIIVDYLQLMSGEDNKGNREQEISKISRGLKELAKELNVPVIALSQLSRGIEHRAGDAQRPKLADLRESGAIEQDADMVAFIYNSLPSEVGVDPRMAMVVHIDIAKHRNGQLKDVLARKDLSIQRFYDHSDGTFQAPVPDIPYNPHAGISPGGGYEEYQEESGMPF